MKRHAFFRKKLLRRALALLIAAATVWGLIRIVDAGALTHVLRGTADDPELAVELFRAELGLPLPDELSWDLSRWDKLILGESALLRTSPAAYAARQRQAKPAPSPLPAGDSDALDGDSEDSNQLPDTFPSSDSVVPRTLKPTSSEGYLCADGVYLANKSGETVDAAILADAPIKIVLPEEGPQVLIMHTHGCEAYTPDGEDTYIPSDNSRTLDKTQNVVRVGSEIQKVFEEMGLRVLHDETLYDYPSYNDAYTNSRTAVENYLAQYPSIKIVLDIHRDALIGDDGTVYKAVTNIDGESAAQVMLVMGTDSRGRYPLWQENLTLAFQIEKSMNTLYPSLARPITLRTSHYNQFLSTGSMLVEVGCHGNTLQEAIRGGRCFARAAGQVLLSLDTEESEGE